MQYLKDEVRNSILEKALIEFRTKGYKCASMRNIAETSGTSVGNVYKYFKNKDALFEVLIGSVYHQAMKCISLFSKVEINDKAQDEYYSLMDNVMDLIEYSSVELSVLLNKSEGSKYENCKTYFINIITDIVTGVVKYRLAKKNEALNDNFMIYLLCQSLVEGIAVILASKSNKWEIRNLILSLVNILYEDIEDKLPGIILRED